MSLRLILLSTLVFTACGEKNTFAPPPPMPVGVMSPIVRDQQTYSEYSGRLEGLQVVEVRAQASGILKEVSEEFEPGKRVEAGTFLFKIDDAPYIAARDAAQASLDKANAAQTIAETTLTARKRAGQGVSQIQVDSAQADVDAAIANVAAANADLKSANVNLDYCTISAPISGRISELYVDQHNLVGTGEPTLLCTIVQDDSMHVYFEADERRSLEFLRRRKGYEDADRTPPTATLTMADGTAYDLPAQLELTDNRLDADTGTLRVRAVVPNPDGKLADGLFVRIKVPHPEGPVKSILVPTTAIQQDLDGSYVLIVSEGNKVVRKKVEPGDQFEKLRIITKGLTGEEKIIVQGLQRIREGSVVDPREAPPGGAKPKTSSAPAGK